MTNHQANILVTSTLNVTNRLEAYGTGDINDANLLKLCYKYACYAADYESLQHIDKIVSDLQMKNPDICMDFSNINGFPLDGTSGEPSVTPSTNTAPTISANTVNILADGLQYTFSYDDFIKDYFDNESHAPGDITIKSLPINGLDYYGIPVMIGQVIDNPSQLTYDRVGDSALVDPFNFTIFDDYPDDPKESLVTVMTVDVAASDNSAPTVGDNTVYVDNRTTTILTLEMFTSQLMAPYNDPEGDLIDAIRIDEISGANQGVYYLSGTPIGVGNIITREDLIAELFTHVGPDVNSVTSDVINFSARDEGSQIWVQ